MEKCIQPNLAIPSPKQLLLIGNNNFHKYGLDADTFRKIFEGGIFYQLGMVKRYRSHMNLVVLLVVIECIMSNTEEAISFINGILDQEVSYARGKNFILRKKREAMDQYFLEYIRY